MILADTAFGTVDFLHGIRKLKHHAVTGIPIDRKLVDGRVLRHLHRQGQQVRLVGLKFPVTVSWYYLKRKDRQELRFVLSTRPLKASTIKWWGKRRWQIEGLFKTAKHRFGLHRFGQGTLRADVPLAHTLPHCLLDSPLDLFINAATQFT